jgi:hypothetical protein
MLENPKTADEVRAALVSKRKAENARLGARIEGPTCALSTRTSSRPT